nr:glycoside hydrolase family 16 protein [Pseudonocardia acidicola]
MAVSGGVLSLTSRGYESAGMAWSPGQRYGRWEVRAKTQRGTGYGPVILLWPDAEDFPTGGEIDFMEIPKGDRRESHFVLHYGRDNSQVGTTVPGDFTQWHNYAVEWTPDHVAGFIDGQEIFRTTDRARIPPRPMHLAIQQDIGPYGKDWIPPLDDTSPAQVRLQVDWVRIYSL